MSWRGHTTDTRRVLLLALLMLFFFQLTSVWIESIYRLSLIKLSMGKELLGVLLFLLPLPLIAAPKRAYPAILWTAFAALLITRALCPLLGAAGLIINGGIGVAAFLVILCFLLVDSDRYPWGHFGAATGLAVLLSVLFRTAGASLDISMEGRTAPAGWVLVALAAWLAQGALPSATRQDTREESTSLLGSLFPCLSLFASLTLISLILSSPAVVAAWTGFDFPFSVLRGWWALQGAASLSVLIAPSMTALLACIMVYAVLKLSEGKALSRRPFLAINAGFAVTLLLGIALHTVRFPESGETPPVFVDQSAMWKLLPILAMFVCSGVVLLNVEEAVRRLRPLGPRAITVPVLLGMAFLVSVTLLLIFTNVWGYIGPIGDHLRHRFYLPFLIACLGMILPLSFGAPKPPQQEVPAGRRSFALGLLCLFLVLGVMVASAAKNSGFQMDKGGGHLRVLSYNMQQGSEETGDRNYFAQLELLRMLAPDIICLQESDTARPSGGNVNAARFFAEWLGFHAYYGPNTISGTYGTAILSRWPIENPRTFFTFSNKDEIGTSVIEIVRGRRRRITVFNSHPAGNDAAHAAHANALAAEAAKCDYVIAAGDYNFRQGSPYYATVTGVLDDAWLRVRPDGIATEPPRGFTAEEAQVPLDMTHRIDHLFISKNIAVEEAWYLPPPASETDHPAHWATVRITPPSGPEIN